MYLCRAPENSAHYTKTQLGRLNKQFFHPSAGKLLNILKREHPDQLCSETHKILKEISARCEPCTRYASATHYISSRMPDAIGFKKEVRMDLMFFNEGGNRQPVLTVVDAGTTFTG
jgi:hypothetical protein